MGTRAGGTAKLTTEGDTNTGAGSTREMRGTLSGASRRLPAVWQALPKERSRAAFTSLRPARVTKRLDRWGTSEDHFVALCYGFSVTMILGLVYLAAL